MGEPLDLEVGDLIGAERSGRAQLFTYFRYDVPLTPQGLGAIGCGHLDPVCLSALDGVADLTDLRQLGSVLAAARVSEGHFGSFL